MSDPNGPMSPPSASRPGPSGQGGQPAEPWQPGPGPTGPPAGSYQSQPGQPLPPGQPVPHPGQPGPHGQPVQPGLPGEAPAPGWGPPPGFGQPAAPAGSSVAGSTWWALAAVVGTVLAVSVPEDGTNGWEDVQVWAAFAVACSLLILAPALRNTFNLIAERAWQVAAGGLVGLGFFWVLFVLPTITENVSFAATLGLAAGGLAVWSAPGRPDPAPDGRG